jgi:nucleoid DNA-binding protein
MIIPSIIRALLEENTVTITGLGTFSVKKLSSHVKEDIVYPPQNIIEFEHSKDIEGFDFVSKFSKWEQIRIDDAQTQISEWLNLFEKGLEHNKSLFFENFGTFSKETSGEIVFRSMISPPLNVENEGFEPIYILSQKKNQKPISTSKPQKDKRNILVNKTKKRNTIWFSLTISVTAILLVALFLKDTITQFYQTVIANNEAVVLLEDDEIDTTAYISIPVENASTVMDTADNNKIVENENNSEISLLGYEDQYIPFHDGKYYVIAGSFMKEEDALRHIKQKKLEKYHAKIVVQPQNPRKRVCIGVFDNEKDAESFAIQTDKNYWILK